MGIHLWLFLIFGDTSTTALFDCSKIFLSSVVLFASCFPANIHRSQRTSASKRKRLVKVLPFYCAVVVWSSLVSCVVGYGILVVVNAHCDEWEGNRGGTRWKCGKNVREAKRSDKILHVVTVEIWMRFSFQKIGRKSNEACQASDPRAVTQVMFRIFSLCVTFCIN